MAAAATAMEEQGEGEPARLRLQKTFSDPIVSMEEPLILRKSISAPAAPSDDATFSLADWHRFHRTRRSCSNLSEASNLWLGRSNSRTFEGELRRVESGELRRVVSGELGSESSPLASCTPSRLRADFAREDFVCKNLRQLEEEYELECVLGKGSFGQVHRARHLRTGAHRAIKELPKVETLAEEFEWELRALVALDHPHIVQVIEHFETADKWFIVMEQCTGPDLHTYIVQHTGSAEDAASYIPERDASVIFRQCLKAVLCCHSHGFVHRDLNPKNFMLTGSDRAVKLIDFGLATRFLPADDEEEIVGTAHYMAPEMMLDGQWTAAADMWSLGVLLFVMLAGTMLLPKDDDKKRKMIKRADFAHVRLASCKQLQVRELSAQPQDFLRQMLMHVPASRVTASRALSHPFVLDHCSEGLGEPLKSEYAFDCDVVAKMRRFSRAPRLKKIALLITAHLVTPEDDEQDLLRAQHSFRAMDTDGDGEVTIDEFRQALSAHSIEEPSDLGRLFAVCTSGGAGRLAFVEFVACTLPRSCISEALCGEVFNVLDRDYNGHISAEDLRIAHPSYSWQDCVEIIGEADPCDKGFLGFDEFHRFLRGASAARSGCGEDAEEPPRTKRRLA